MDKRADHRHPIDDLIARRWSPYSLTGAPIPQQDLCSLFEAARWAPSSYNEQPWRFFVAERADAEEFQRLLSCLVEANQVWAQHASALVIAVTVRRFARNGKDNLACEHDLGLAAANLSVEATALGIAVHQMIGIDRDRARQVLGIPDDATPLTAIAIGYAGPTPQPLQEELVQRDRAPRTRKPLSDFVFRAGWGTASPLVEP